MKIENISTGNYSEQIRSSITTINEKTAIPGTNDTWSIYTDQILRNISNGSYKLVIAKDDQDAIVGYAVFRSDSRRTFRDMSHKKREAPYLSYLAVLPEHQKQGIGKALVLQVIAKVRSVGRLYLDCRSEGEINFYRKIGSEIGGFKETSQGTYFEGALKLRVKFKPST